MSSSDSDSDDFDVPVIVKPRAEWADEDAAPAPAPAPVEAAAGAGERDPNRPLRPKEIAKQKKREAKARREAEAAEIRKRLDELKPLDDPVAERERRRKLVEDADHALTEELFADEKNDPILTPIMGLELPTAAEYESFGSAVARKLNSGANPALTMMFFTGLIAATEESIGADEIREITKLLNQLRNAKIKENSANKKKKGKKKTKAKMKMGTDDDWLTAQTGDMDDYGDYDDFI